MSIIQNNISYLYLVKMGGIVLESRITPFD